LITPDQCTTRLLDRYQATGARRKEIEEQARTERTQWEVVTLERAF
jgi:hypothetical protein